MAKAIHISHHVTELGARTHAAPESQTRIGFVIAGRRRLILWASLFALGFYLLQVVLSVGTTLLDGFAVGPFTWGWIYAVAQFLVPLAVLHFYQARSAALDAEAGTIAEQIDA